MFLAVSLNYLALLTILHNLLITCTKNGHKTLHLHNPCRNLRILYPFKSNSIPINESILFSIQIIIRNQHLALTFKRTAFGLWTLASRYPINTNTICFTSAVVVVNAMTCCTFYFTLTVWLAETGGVADFAFPFFYETLTACRILFHCAFPLHFDCWLTAAVIFVAGTINCITFQSGHGITFFLLFKQFYILPIHKSHPEIYRYVFSNRYG